MVLSNMLARDLALELVFLLNRALDCGRDLRGGSGEKSEEGM